MRTSFMLLFILILAYFCTVPNWDYTTSVTNLLSVIVLLIQLMREHSGMKRMIN